MTELSNWSWRVPPEDHGRGDQFRGKANEVPVASAWLERYTDKM